MTDVYGYCPLGCGATLFVGEGGFITCSNKDCPQPDAVSLILGDNETEHVAEISEAGFILKHPLRERLDDALFGCSFATHLEELSGAPVPPGRYRVIAGTPSSDGTTAYGYERVK